MDGMQRTAGSEIEGAVLDQADRLFAQVASRTVLAEADGGKFPRSVWRAIEEAGFASALVPEPLGGSGLDARTGLLLVRRAAYHNLPVPLAEVMLARHLWAGLAGSQDAGLITIAGAADRDSASLVPDGSGWVLSGMIHRVPWGRTAEAVLLVAPCPDGQARWVRAPAGSYTVSSGTNLANEPRDTLVFDRAHLPFSAVQAGPPCSELLLHGARLRVQQMVGAMQRALDSAVEYSMVRVQFGRTISKFQAVQQMLAEAAGHLAAATAAADATLDVSDQELPLAIAIAKARVGEAAGRVAATAHQVHAAMGFTQEHHLHYSTRHLWSWRDEFGSEPFWQRQVGRFVCRLGGEGLWPLLADGQDAAGFAVAKQPARA